MGHGDDYPDFANKQHAPGRFWHSNGRSDALKHERDMERLPRSDIRVSMGSRGGNQYSRRDFIVVSIG